MLPSPSATVPRDPLLDLQTLELGETDEPSGLPLGPANEPEKGGPGDGGMNSTKSAVRKNLRSCKTFARWRPRSRSNKPKAHGKNNWRMSRKLSRRKHVRKHEQPKPRNPTKAVKLKERKHAKAKAAKGWQCSRRRR